MNPFWDGIIIGVLSTVVCLVLVPIIGIILAGRSVGNE